MILETALILNYNYENKILKPNLAKEIKNKYHLEQKIEKTENDFRELLKIIDQQMLFNNFH